MLGTIQGNLLQFNQELPLVKPTHKCEVKVAKTQENMMTSEISSMLFKGTKELGSQRTRDSLHIPSQFPRKNGESHFIMSLKPLNQFITCTMFKMNTPKQKGEVICSGQWIVSLNIKSAYCHTPIPRRHYWFLCFRWKGKVYQFKTLPFSLSTAPKMFMRVMKSTLHLC